MRYTQKVVTWNAENVAQAFSAKKSRKSGSEITHGWKESRSDGKR